MESDQLIESMVPYIILSKQESLALTAKQSNQAKIYGESFDPQNIGQLFFLQKQSRGSDTYKIIHLQSDTLLTIDSRHPTLMPESNNLNQDFILIKSPAISPYFWIKTEEEPNKSVSLDKTLKLSPYFSSDEKQMFRVQKAASNNVFKQSCFVINQFSEKVMENRHGTEESGIWVVQNRISKRFSQRWIWQRHGTGYFLKNVMSELCLGVNEAKEVIATKKTEDDNQLWLPEALGKGIYKIRCVLYPSTCLRVKHESLVDNQLVEISSQDNRTSFWIIEGALP